MEGRGLQEEDGKSLFYLSLEDAGTVPGETQPGKREAKTPQTESGTRSQNPAICNGKSCMLRATSKRHHGESCWNFLEGRERTESSPFRPQCLCLLAV